MASPAAHERRITALEGRVTEVETNHGDSIYRLRRDTIANRLGMEAVLDHLKLPRVTEDRIDDVLDQE